jgi:hypothetical protein
MKFRPSQPLGRSIRALVAQSSVSRPVSPADALHRTYVTDSYGNYTPHVCTYIRAIGRCSTRVAVRTRIPPCRGKKICAAYASPSKIALAASPLWTDGSHRLASATVWKVTKILPPLKNFLISPKNSIPRTRVPWPLPSTAGNRANPVDVEGTIRHRPLPVQHRDRHRLRRLAGGRYGCQVK